MRSKGPAGPEDGERGLAEIDFVLAEEDAEALRRIASLEPIEARSFLQDHPELARRMTTWPPELRLEVCRIIYRSFPEAQREQMAARRSSGTNLLQMLEGEA